MVMTKETGKMKAAEEMCTLWYSILLLIRLQRHLSCDL